nr:tRNA specific adenosine deaminase 2 [Hymenolepis microstoma]
MEKAFELAEEALNAAEVPVGCVFIYNNEVIASGRNEVNATGDATQHAEIVAIRKLSQWCEENGQRLEAVLPETTLHVTVEPCIMCAAALRFSLPAQPKCIIYYSQNERFGGCGSVMNIHTDESIQPPLICKSGGSPERSIGLLKKFFNQENLNAPMEKRIKKDQREQA